MVFSGIALLAAFGAAAAVPDALSNVSADIVRLAGRLPASLRDLLVGIMQVAIIVAPIVLVIWAARWRRGRQLAVVLLGGLVALVVMSLLIDWLDRIAPPSLVDIDPEDSWFADVDFPSVSYVAGLAAVVTMVAPAVSRGWRHVAWSTVALAALVRTMTATQVPVNVAIAATMGVFVGSAVLVAVGAPVRRPGRERLDEALSAVRLDLAELDDTVVAAADGRAWRGRTVDGRAIRLVYVGADERDTDLLYRFWRRLRVKGLEDESPGATPRRLARNEALVTSVAASRGVDVPRVLGLDESDDGSAVLAVEWPEAVPLASLAAEEVDDDVLARVWHEVRGLHDAGLAHRRLHTDRILVADDRAVLTGFRWGRIGARDEQIHTDVAELLVATALLVGAERAVAAAATETDRRTLVDAMPYVQPLALSGPTRRAARRVDGLLDSVRDELQRVTGVEEPELEPLARLTITGVVTGVGFFVLVGFALGLAANFGDIVDAMSGADWAYLPWILAAMVVTYVGGALSLRGSVLRPLPLVESTTVMFGQSFLNRFTPANAGGMAMRIRYLQKGGTDGAVATTAIGLTSAASGVMQVVMIALFFTWGGSTPGGGDTASLDGSGVALALLGAVAVLGIVWAVPQLRRTVLSWTRRAWSQIRDEYGELARRPAKLAELFGGAGLSKLFYIVAFAWSCRAFGIELGFAELGALYLTSTTIASAVPTPGGVGAIESALVFVLTGADVSQPVAWSATLLFRLVTYWLPTLPGWLALKYCERAEIV